MFKYADLSAYKRVKKAIDDEEELNKTKTTMIPKNFNILLIYS